MTRRQPRLSQIPLWEQHVDLVLAVLRDALQLLSRRWPTGGEVDRNRVLYECLMLAIRMRHDDGLPTIDAPIFGEARNQPTPATAGGSAERKIPDFQCGYIDHYCADALSSSRIFVIECKKLGKPTAAGWKFNERYVADGINRFVDLEYQYGNNTRSGAMVGYVDDTPIAEVLAAVNETAEARGLPSLLHRIDADPLHELDHELARAFAESPFSLAHLWIRANHGANC